MNIALIHDSLVEYGGSERILDVLLSMFPGADLYTAITRIVPGSQLSTMRLPQTIHTSFLQRFPVEHHTSGIQAAAPLIWRSFNLSRYDLVISQSNHLMPCMVRVPNGIHISYIPSVPKNIFGLIPKTPLQQKTRYDRIIRPLYIRSVQLPLVISNSVHTQAVLRRYTGVESTVMYPPVAIPANRPVVAGRKYFLCVTRIEPDKCLELAVEAATAMGVNLYIVGISNTPLYESHLRAIAGPTVQFLGYRSDAETEVLYRNATAFLFPSGNEDFGIAPLEATAHCIPVIAHYGGGAKETIIDGKTGLFFRPHTTEALMHAMAQVMTMKFQPSVLYNHAKQFSVAQFQKKFMRYVDAALKTKTAFRQ